MPHPSQPAFRGEARLLILLALSVFGVIVLRTAWLNDDAYITFRTIDNFVNGYGLTWNVAERVQAYTHPLWMLVLTPFYALTRDIYFTGLTVSIVVSLGAVLILGLWIGETPQAALLGLACVTLSKAFIEYSTSGLENPLTHLLLAAFIAVYLRAAPNHKTLVALSLLTGLAALNRLDAALLLLPALAFVAWPLRSRKAAVLVIAGFLPIIVWEVFSVAYYGFPFPNTAYAKLNTHIPAAELMWQGLFYFIDSAGGDPLTLVVITVGALAPVLMRRWRLLPFTIGIGLYLLYIVRIGGDFMSGRFFAAPFLVAVALLGQFPFRRWYPGWLLSFAAVAALGWAAPHSPVLGDAEYALSTDFQRANANQNIADERAFYYPYTGLLRATRPGRWVVWPDHPWAWEGYVARGSDPNVIFTTSMGFFGFWAGPDVYIVDEYALADPLLARLPALYDPNWRIGHFKRAMPEGYYDTLVLGHNAFRDPDLASYYEHLALITRGPLFDWERLLTIWRMNTGQYDDLIDVDSYRFATRVKVPSITVAKPRTTGTSLTQAGNFIFKATGIEVDFAQRVHYAQIEASLDSNDDYAVVFYADEVELGRQIQMRWPTPAGGLTAFTLDVPPRAVQEGYDRVHIYPLRGDDVYVLGHLAGVK